MAKKGSGSAIAAAGVIVAAGAAGAAYLLLTKNPGGLGVQASANPSTVKAGQPVIFTASAYGGTPPYGYTWDFGDGTPSLPGSSVSHVYLYPGNFNARVTAVDTAGGSASVSVLVTVATATFTVKVVDGLTQAPVVGATVTYGSASIATASDGSAVFGVLSGYQILDVKAAGYQEHMEPNFQATPDLSYTVQMLSLTMTNLSFFVQDTVSGLPVSGVQVQISGPASKTGTTDSQGLVSMGIVPQGLYSVTASKTGYVTGNWSLNIGIQLLPVNLTLLGTRPYGESWIIFQAYAVSNQSGIAGAVASYQNANTMAITGRAVVSVKNQAGQVVASGQSSLASLNPLDSHQFNIAFSAAIPLGSYVFTFWAVDSNGVQVAVPYDQQVSL